VSQCTGSIYDEDG